MTKATGLDVNYYLVTIRDPKRLQPYEAEAEDIIEALGMTFAEGNAFKAIWRSCAARTLGVQKPGVDAEGVYDAEKVVYYGQRIVAVRKRAMAARQVETEGVQLRVPVNTLEMDAQAILSGLHGANRIYDLLLGGDGQAYKEAERFLERHFPDLYKELQTRRAELQLGIPHK